MNLYLSFTGTMIQIRVRSYQSEVLYEAVRGSGGTARLVLLPHEDHGYSAKENIEHVLWEQLRWFDKHLKEK